MMHMQNDPNAPITSAERAQRSVFGEIIMFNQLLMQEHFNVFQNFLKKRHFNAVRIFSILSLNHG